MLVATIFGAEQVILAGFGGLEPSGGVAARHYVLLGAEGGHEEAVDDIFGRHGQPDRAADRDVQLIDFALAFQASGCDSISAATNDMRWSPSDAASDYLIEPAVRPPTTLPSMKANRMITGMVAITEPANRWPQSTEYWPM